MLPALMLYVGEVQALKGDTGLLVCQGQEEGAEDLTVGPPRKGPVTIEGQSVITTREAALVPMESKGEESVILYTPESEGGLEILQFTLTIRTNIALDMICG
mmetsp:Transcript_33813/g.71109  ORF Transcript_33813/g.71109 Transcript_33813/m.71109 type:complete len:102 (-) Transcript_33813:2776-3081(-)